MKNEEEGIKIPLVQLQKWKKKYNEEIEKNRNLSQEQPISGYVITSTHDSQYLLELNSKEISNKRLLRFAEKIKKWRLEILKRLEEEYTREIKENFNLPSYDFESSGQTVPLSFDSYVSPWERSNNKILNLRQEIEKLNKKLGIETRSDYPTLLD